jgi:hypothetical protein
LVESLLGPNWANSESRGGPSRAVARKAWRESRFARFIGWRFPNYAPHTLRVSGRAAFALGKAKQAVRCFERAIAAAEKLGARYDLARAYLDASRVVREKADEYRRLGQELLDELGAVVPEAERKVVDSVHMRISSRNHSQLGYTHEVALASETRSWSETPECRPAIGEGGGARAARAPVRRPDAVPGACAPWASVDVGSLVSGPDGSV